MPHSTPKVCRPRTIGAEALVYDSIVGISVLVACSTKGDMQVTIAIASKGKSKWSVSAPHAQSKFQSDATRLLTNLSIAAVG
jgi:hypothetical protein